MTIKIGLSGAGGSMGLAIQNQIHKFSEAKVTGVFTRDNKIGDLESLCQDSDVIIDFSSPELLEYLTNSAIKCGTKLVIGTTGFNQTHFDLLQKAAKSCVIVYSANMTLGANLISLLAAHAAALLDNDFDIEIIEAHHRFKKDAPSGTALMMGQACAVARNLNFEESAIYNRHNKGARQPNDIGFASIRGGNIFGEHEVLFAGSNEIVSLKHQALNKDCFADGALTAAIWAAANEKRGLYSMQDVLSSKLKNLPLIKKE